MKKNVQKLLSIVLTVIMMISMLPFSVFAADLDVYDVEEPAVEAVSVPAEEQEIESTVEDVLVGNAETEDELLVEDAEIVEDSSEEIETVDAADPAEADAVEESEEFAATETVGAGADGTGFPASFKYGNVTYEKYGDPVGLNAQFRVDGVNSSTWEFLNESVISYGKIYYQEYRSGGSKIVVWELPTTVQISQGSGYYINPDSQTIGGRISIGRYNGAWATPTFSDDAYFGNSKQYKIVREGKVTQSTDGPFKYLAKGETTYSFDDSARTRISDKDPVDVLYLLHSGTQGGPIISKTYKITYKDGVNDEDIFDDQEYKDEDAIDGHLTPHFKWPNKEIGSDGDPVRPGYKFAGWIDQDGVNRGNSDAVAGIKIRGDATYTAQWTPLRVKVTKEVVAGDGVVSSEINQTIKIALWNDTDKDYLRDASDNIVTKEIVIQNGVPNPRTVTFDENDQLECVNYSVDELDANGKRLKANETSFEVDGKTITVTDIQGAELNASGEVILDDNNTHLDQNDTALVRMTNTYSSTDTLEFKLNKRWYDYQGNDVTSTIKGVSATITLYRYRGDTIPDDPEVVENITLTGAPWTANFKNLDNTYKYVAKETDCTAGYKPYATANATEPMGTSEYKGSNENIYNIQDHITVYHSSDGTMESLPVEPNTTVNLAGMVKGNNLYGGYYEYAEGTATKRGKAYSASGLNMTPTNKIYYLKEVPDTYLRPQVYVLFNRKTNELTGLYAMTAIDEGLTKDSTGSITGGYLQSGLVIDRKPTSGTPAGELEFKRGDDVYASLTSNSVFKVAGDLSYVDAGIEWSTRTISAYYVTPDSVKVTGIRERQFDIGDGTFKGWTNDSAGLRQTANKAVKTTAEDYSISSVNGKFSRRVATIKVDPDNVTAVITKVEDGKKYTQTVEKGDNTGKVVYSGKNNYVFAGWYTDAAYTTAADFSDVTGDMTVYAKYVKASNFKLSFARKTVKNDAVTLKSTLKITGEPNIADAEVACELNGNSYIVEFTSQKTTKSGKTSVDTYTGTVKIEGLANGSVFTAVISYKTADGTIVNVNAKKCTYRSGLVTVK